MLTRYENAGDLTGIIPGIRTTRAAFQFILLQKILSSPRDSMMYEVGSDRFMRARFISVVVNNSKFSHRQFE